jgi:hypothetical protein
LDEDVFEIEAVQDQWRSPGATFFKVRTAMGKHYLLRYVEVSDRWTLQSDFDGAELFARTSIEMVAVEPAPKLLDTRCIVGECERRSTIATAEITKGSSSVAVAKKIAKT